MRDVLRRLYRFSPLVMREVLTNLRRWWLLAAMPALVATPMLIGGFPMGMVFLLSPGRGEADMSSI